MRGCNVTRDGLARCCIAILGTRARYGAASQKIGAAGMVSMRCDPRRGAWRMHGVRQVWETQAPSLEYSATHRTRDVSSVLQVDSLFPGRRENRRVYCCGAVSAY